MHGDEIAVPSLLALTLTYDGRWTLVTCLAFQQAIAHSCLLTLSLGCLLNGRWGLSASPKRPESPVSCQCSWGTDP